jgi:pseudaminic acid cytidylyltransferase
MNIAIIPARGGSKRIPHKNIKEFCGKPMIAYAIEAAQETGLFERIIVSTDSEEIATVARFWGGETPFIRPHDLADDFVTTAPVIAHAVRECQAFGWDFNFVCCIYPCVPFVRSDDIQQVFGRLVTEGVPYCFPVVQYAAPIQRAFTMGSNCRLKPVSSDHELTRTQDLPATFYDAGQFYWGTVGAWLTNPNIHSNGLGYVIPSWRVADIDSADDWLRAEIIAPSVFKASNSS